MLVLTRKFAEKIVIDLRGMHFPADNFDGVITIQVTEIPHGKVRLGIEAPKDVPVHREEVFDKINAALEGINKEGLIEIRDRDPRTGDISIFLKNPL